ncbi:Protein MAIN-LIKE 2, partial [Linum perenne]
WYPAYEPFLTACRLREVCRILGSTPCKQLVTALIKMWWPETNTFHLIQGEATITLEDVEVLTGLPTRGLPLTAHLDKRTPSAICQERLGVEPPARPISRAIVKVSWVKGLFDRLPTRATPEVVTIYARAFTWVLVGAVLLVDRTGDHIPVYLLPLIGDPVVVASFSWGSAVLAWLYLVMGRVAFFTGSSQKGTSDLGGFTLLVQLWALERFLRIVERYIEQGAPPVDDSIPRGLRWIPYIIGHQKAMWLLNIRYALDRCTEFLVRIPILYSFSYLISLFLPYNNIISSLFSRGCRTHAALRIM